MNNNFEFNIISELPKVQIELGFWKTSSNLKYNELKLQNEYIDIFGFYNSQYNIVRIREESIKSNNKLHESEYNNLIKGKLRLLNSLHEILHLNKDIESNPQIHFSTNIETINNWFSEINNKKHEHYPFSFLLLIYFDFKKQIAYYSICFSNINKVFEFKILNNSDSNNNPSTSDFYDIIILPITHNDKNNNSSLNLESIKNSKLCRDILIKLKKDISKYSNNVVNCPWFFITILSYILIDKDNITDVISIKPNFIKQSNSMINNKAEINDDKLLSFDLRTHFDSYTIQQKINNINIDLIRWRIAPEFDPNKFKNLRFLLIGSGTLGCSVSRNLIGWGIRNITLVDNSEVSLNNPSRQCLFTFEDAKLKKNKASAAIERLRYICPDLMGHDLPFDVPILNDPTISDNEFIQKCEELKEIIQDSDVILLLTDTKESRLIPTILTSFINRHHRNKDNPILCITVGLGFDSFVVTRNTFIEDKVTSDQNDSNGCYFCGDLSVNSKTDLFDIPIDQQCSVVRIGNSYIASSIAVELIINLSQSNGYWNSTHCDNVESILGSYPQCIRGCLNGFSIKNSSIQRNNNCIACSNKISDEMLNNEKNFLCQIFNDPKQLETFSGLDKYKQHIENNINIISDF
ncbi:hypothetical protein FG379_002455 [Cryptosporidium bovis]|uniref:uncharacterized protein n=1 Tax=Cryptosporidium bovis TaxID=310047 RepID=UPI00351A4E8A|nr:hypothetical protein FG379_002455 [Cryptosporidium bovis]